MKTVVLMVSVLFSFPALASDWFTPFNSKDWAWQGAATVAAVADWGTTLDGIDKGLDESNPILGLTPSRGEVNAFFIITIPLKWLIAYALPQHDTVAGRGYNPRRVFQVVITSVSVISVANNISVGASISF